uniref:proline--tRNA ligase n=1 Tax=Lygus hesperus TaxID=30085 RepID=A0A0A9XUI0_LYGHE
MFDITFLSKENDTKYVYQTCWGFTTRSIGIMVMTHSDDKGLVLPPRVAPKQVVIIPILRKGDQDKLLQYIREIEVLLSNCDIRVEVDDRDIYTPGWKYTDWEMRGIPLRIEVGMREVESTTCKIVRRDNGESYMVNKDELHATVPTLLQTIQDTLYNNSKRSFEENVIECTTWDTFLQSIHDGKLALSPWCGSIPCENTITQRSTVHMDSSTDEPESKDSTTGKISDQNSGDREVEPAKKIIAGAKSLCIP